MTTTALPLTFRVVGTDDRITLDSFQGVVAGYTGRDPAAVQHHIDELAAIGVAPPPEIPMFYSMPTELFSAADEHGDSTTLTSGEVEPLYVRHRGKYYLGVGSDHTDRDLEIEGVEVSKRACPKPVADHVVALDAIDSVSLDDWVARSWVDGRLYQEGSLDGLRTPADVIGLFTLRQGLKVDEDFVCLGGTLPLLDGVFMRGTQWRIEIEGPGGITLSHTYTMTNGMNA